MKWTILAVLMAVTSWAFAQDTQGHGQRNDNDKDSDPVTSSVVGPQLIAWSDFQKPQPVADAIALVEVQSGTVQQSPSSPAQDSQPAAQTFTGMIVKDGARYVLKVSKQVYELDDQDRAKSYEGKQVKVNGNLDAKGDMLHVLNIELIS